MKILVVDVGGTHIKLTATGRRTTVKIPSGPALTPKQMVADIKKAVAGWKYDAVTIGFPAPVVRNHPRTEPHNLGPGWMRFNFQRAFGCPVRVINDAAMQALGSYQGGRMLFLGLGTGLGAAMVIDGALQPMELAHLPYKNGRTYEQYLGIPGLKRLGKKKWRRCVADVVKKFEAAFQTDYVILGGGNARQFKKPPPGARLGDNNNALRGGFRLWKESKPPC
jgi:polyphosphate glucokinase